MAQMVHGPMYRWSGVQPLRRSFTAEVLTLTDVFPEVEDRISELPRMSAVSRSESASTLTRLSGARTSAQPVLGQILKNWYLNRIPNTC